MAQSTDNVKTKSIDLHGISLVVKAIGAIVRGGAKRLENPCDSISHGQQVYTSPCNIILRVNHRQHTNTVLSQIPRRATVFVFRSDDGTFAIRFELSEEFRIPLRDLGIPTKVRHKSSSLRGVKSLLYRPLYSSVVEPNFFFTFDLLFRDTVRQAGFQKLLDIPSHHFNQALGHSLRAELRPYSGHTPLPTKSSLNGTQDLYSVPLKYKAEGQWQSMGHELQIQILWVRPALCANLQIDQFAPAVPSHFSVDRVHTGEETKEAQTRLDVGSSIQHPTSKDRRYESKAAATEAKWTDVFWEAKTRTTLPTTQDPFALDDTENILQNHECKLREPSTLNDTSMRRTGNFERKNLAANYCYHSDAHLTQIAGSSGNDRMVSEYSSDFEHGVEPSVQKIPARPRCKFPVPQHKTRRYFRQISKRPLRQGEMVTESDDEVDCHWLEQLHEEAATEETGSTSTHHRFCKLWNSHLCDEDIQGNLFVGSALLRFVTKYRAEWKDQHMLRSLWDKVVDFEYNGVIASADSGRIFQLVESVQQERPPCATTQSSTY